MTDPTETLPLNCEYAEAGGVINPLPRASQCSRVLAHVVTLRLISGRHRVDDLVVATQGSTARCLQAPRRAAG
jgi:hypothetical protein